MFCRDHIWNQTLKIKLITNLFNWQINFLDNPVSFFSGHLFLFPTMLLLKCLKPNYKPVDSNIKVIQFTICLLYCVPLFLSCSRSKRSLFRHLMLPKLSQFVSLSTCHSYYYKKGSYAGTKDKSMKR